MFAGESVAGEIRFLENGNPSNKGIESGYLSDTPTRLKIDLSGEWSYNLGGNTIGVVQVPSAFDYTGQVTYERKFALTSEQLDTYEFLLVMYGANYNTTVSINGDFLVNHLGGYTSFSQQVPVAKLQPGPENVIQVVVHNYLNTRNSLPLRSQVWEWRNYGGILRDIYLLAIPKLSFHSVAAGSEISQSLSSATLRVHADFEGELPAGGDRPVQGRKRNLLGAYTELVDKITGAPVARSPLVPVVRADSGWTNVTMVVPVQNVKLWSPDSPDLYFLRCLLVRITGTEMTLMDEFDMNYGFKKIQLGKHDILLNGKRLVLKGVVWIEDHSSWGSSLTYEEMEKDIVLVKNLGANAIRFGFHPPHPYMLNLCDRYGLLALEELPVVNVPAAIFQDEAYSDLAGSMLREMVMRDRNHVSVLAWGIGDEFQTSTSDARRFVSSLVNLVRTLDGGLTYFGARMSSDDSCMDLVDIAALNIHDSDQKTMRKHLEQWKLLHASMPVVVGKFGCEVQGGNRNGYTDPLSEEAQVRYFTQRLDIIRALDYDGAFVWSLNDWKGDRPSLIVNSGDPWMHTMGLVSQQREKRLAYEAVRRLLRGEKPGGVSPGTYSASSPIVYVISGLALFIGIAYVYNASRRFREGLHRSVLNAYNFFADIRDQRIVSYVQSTLLGVVVSLATGIVVSSILYHFRNSWILDNLLSHILIYDDIKQWSVRIIWDPVQCVLFLSGVFFLLHMVTFALVRAIGPAFRSKIYAYHAYTITMWASVPLLLLIPVGMILYRVLESDAYILPALLLPLALFAWVHVRLLKALAIVTDIMRAKVYTIGLITVLGCCACVYFYLDYTRSTTVFFSYMYHVVISSR